MSGRSHRRVRRWAVGLVRLASLARESLPRPQAILALLFTVLPLLAPSAIADDEAALAGLQPGARARQLPPELPNDPPASPALLGLRSAAVPVEVQVGPFRGVQVNLDAFGDNIVGDAACEPSAEVGPLRGLRSDATVTDEMGKADLSTLEKTGYLYFGPTPWG